MGQQQEQEHESEVITMVSGQSCGLVMIIFGLNLY